MIKIFKKIKRSIKRLGMSEEEKALDEIEELDEEIEDILRKSRYVMSLMEDNEETRELKEHFEEYVRVAREKGIVR